MERLIADNLDGDFSASIPPDERFVVECGTWVVSHFEYRSLGFQPPNPICLAQSMEAI
jgi:hypothetical protein